MLAIKNSIFPISRFLGQSAAKSTNTLGNKHGISTVKATCDFHSGIRNNAVKKYISDIPCKKYLDVRCKTALITGGFTGIGLAIADSLLQSGLNKVYLSGINHCKAIRAVRKLVYKHGQGRCDYIYIDVNNAKQFEDAFKYIICRDGSVDILVNNAGMLNDKQWDLEFDTNVKGVVRGSLLANKYMPTQRNRGGCVVNIASILGFDSFPYAPGYNSTKHAVVGFTKSFGEPSKFYKNGVRHIAIGPGVTGTELVHESAPRMLTEEWGRKTLQGLYSLPYQTTAVVGRGTTYTIEYGPPGSLWVIEDCMLQRIIPPLRQTYQKKNPVSS